MTVFNFARKLLELKAKEKNMKYFVCLLILISSSAYADSIYKWVDEDGNTHYGDIPPPSVHTEELRVDVAPSDPGRALPRLETSDPGSSAPSPSSPGSPDSAEPDPEMTDDQAKAICEQAHLEIKVLNNSKRRTKVKNPDGSHRRMTTEERKANRKQSEQDIKDFCK
jgi:Domain of unknown function (DUF4124)